MNSSTIPSLPTLERPRERCLTSGAACLSLRECLAIILNSGPPGLGCMGLADQLLNRPGTGLEIAEKERAFFTALEVSGHAYLKELSGLGPAGQAKVLATFEIARRYAQFRCSPQEKKTHSFSKAATQALKKISHQQRLEPQEWFGFVPLHRTGEIGGFCLVEKGARTHVNIDPTELFARLLPLRPRGFYIFHNHPSNQLTPSIQDLDLTEQVRETAHSFGIELLGHWIVTPTQEKWIHPSLKHDTER